MTLEELLRTKVLCDAGGERTPDFRVAVQRLRDDGVHIIVHACGHDSETLDFIVRGDQLTNLNP